MRKHSIAALLWVGAAALGTIAGATSAAAVTPITACGTLESFGATYVVGADLSAGCGPCFVVANDRITIDLGGHTIYGECEFPGVSDDEEPRVLTVVRNGAITGFSSGISLGNSIRTEIRNVDSSNNSSHGMLLGPQSLVRDCVATNNGGDGINMREASQVQGCLIDGNAGFGIFAFTQPELPGLLGGALITDNTVTHNLTGILVGQIAPPEKKGGPEFPSTVSFNTVSDNQLFGISAGRRVLVTGNITDANGADGIAFGAFSTVSFNLSRGNGVDGIDPGLLDFFDGQQGFDATHSLVTGNVTTDNGLAGISAQCPSVVTNNKSSGNQVVDYNPAGLPGCHAANNK